jgi:hypothetical protein
MARKLLPCLVLLLAVSCLHKLTRAAATEASVAAAPVITLRQYSEPNGALILHGLCYKYRKPEPDGDQSNLLPELHVSDCCHLLLQGIDNWSSITSDTTSESNSNLKNVLLHSCLEEIVPIPTVPEPHIVSNGTVSQLPTFSFWYTSAMMESSSSRMIQPPSIHHNTAQSAAAPDNSLCNLWHGSTDASPDDNARSKRFVRLLNSETNLEESSMCWTAFMESSLADSGGLHRDLEHRITLTPPKSNVNVSWVTNDTMQVSLYLLIHLPSDLFVNVQDLFRYSTSTPATTSWNVTLVPPLAVIDQEEPSFVSPAHALLVHVSARLDNDGSLGWMHTQYTLHFGTKLHVRYPKPFAVPYNTSANFRQVMMPRPELLTGTVIWHHSTGADTYNIHVPACRPSLTPLHPLELWIAAGHQYQYHVVWWVTLLVAIVGALVMLRDIAAASTWE